MKHRFAQHMTSEEIKKQITLLAEHKIISELNGYLTELKFRKRRLKIRILDEMLYLYGEQEELRCGGKQ